MHISLSCSLSLFLSLFPQEKTMFALPTDKRLNGVRGETPLPSPLNDSTSLPHP